MYNIDYSIAHAHARGTYFYEIKLFRLKKNSCNLQKFCTLKITWWTEDRGGTKTVLGPAGAPVGITLSLLLFVCTNFSVFEILGLWHN